MRKAERYLLMASQARVNDPNPETAARAQRRREMYLRKAAEEDAKYKGRSPSVLPTSFPSSEAESVPVAAGLATGMDSLKAQAASLTGMEVPAWIAPAAIGTVAVGGAAALTAYAVSRRSKRKSSKKSSRKGSKSRSRPGKGGVVRGKKDRNRRGGAVRDSYKGRKVYRTKRGQPYILMANGKARFVRA